MPPFATLRRSAALLAASATLCAGLGACSTAPERPSDPAGARTVQGSGDPHAARDAEIVDVIDGDTLDVRLADGRRQRVRLLGIDAPENTTLRTGSTECGGAEATAAATALARRWRGVTLRPDPTQDALDRYDRLLAYVEPRTGPPTTFQEELLRQGWAKVYVFDRSAPFARARAFRRAAEAARTAQTGVWSACGGDFRRRTGG